jgi:predicted DNA-binding transcriptional regulator AlpA
MALSHFSQEVRRRRPLPWRLVCADELASVKEVADILGVSKRTAARYVDRADFPEPLDVLAAGRVWRRADVEKWAAATLPLKRTGRPRKEL